MKIIGQITVGFLMIATGFFLSLFASVVFINFYDWFIKSIFILPKLTIFNVWGILFFISSIFSYISLPISLNIDKIQKKEDDSSWFSKVFVQQFAIGIFLLITWFLGFVLNKIIN